ncbi:SDR family NAD(P)-dependent oxidoreductase [Cobetia sp. 14N.309.X.WAT.E.A4]|uniref:SDR family NAD(P)-dependent oxidoreductase n=1 Tax=Cobetia sp. 14N.309.X.WAT.E.A4 TaxID=2998323 RepID=UPI0025B0D9E5|nr:SDR family NAD(P)-dependent oxidoreductase [Cobetia sp. 14N.309.X.WAT.E.A4]MDN2657992.1 SDR family NAD(P)-dependent oxidoreductase [Cobetia sp. 14N.309.X.WAT.E.A4]
MTAMPPQQPDTQAPSARDDATTTEQREGKQAPDGATQQSSRPATALRRVLITGATGEIGGALARAYAARGTTLILTGRKQRKLDAIAGECRALGAEVECTVLNLCDEETLFTWLDEVCAQGVPDIAIANAGMNTDIGPQGNGERWEDARRLLQTNVVGTFGMAHHLAMAMKARGSGQLVLLSSLAAWHGLALTPSYSGSKAAVKAYGEGLRSWLKPFGVGVTVVMPGYVTSPMCEAMPGPKPFEMPAEQAARRILKGAARNRARISFPFPLNFGCWWLSVLPAGISQRLLGWFNYTH